MDIDALAATRPIEYPVASPDEANQMFDSLTYGKGQAVLRMLEVYLGEDTFRRGIRRYLRTHAHANTETADLWAALEEESGEPVGELMEGWIFQGGFPRLNVARAGDRIRITQEHFRYLGEGGHEWKVPVLYGDGTSEGRVVVAGELELDAGPDLLLNRRGQGFYRVRYEPAVLAELVGRFAELSPDERYAVVSDTWANVLSGDTSAAEFVQLVSGLGDETEPAVWGVALSGLNELDRVASSDARPWLQKVVRSLVGPAADRVGWEPAPEETDLQRQLRGILIAARGNLGDDERTRDLAGDVFEKWLADRDSVDGEVGAAALTVLAHHGDVDFAERLVALYHGADNPQDEVRYLRAAAAVPDVAASRRALDMVLGGEVRSQDAISVLARLLGNRDTGAAVWEMMKERWDEVVAAPPPQTVRHIVDLVPLRSEPEVAADIEAWLRTHPLPGGDKYVAQQIERMNVRVGLRAREGGRLGPLAEG
jgi:puromycin-sensitive aminopeptidase